MAPRNHPPANAAAEHTSTATTTSASLTRESVSAMPDTAPKNVRAFAYTLVSVRAGQNLNRRPFADIEGDPQHGQEALPI
ncbi:MAG TPA: hypothetical protein VHJ58_14255 [Vicinamibacterales bacterium]|nr:hypothetical protein [Vicinamibacterales bacterium]